MSSLFRQGCLPCLHVWSGPSMGHWGQLSHPTRWPPHEARVTIMALQGQTHWCKTCLLSSCSSKKNKQLHIQTLGWWVSQSSNPLLNHNPTLGCGDMERTTTKMASHSIEKFCHLKLQTMSWCLWNKVYNPEPLPGNKAKIWHLCEDHDHCTHVSK